MIKNINGIQYNVDAISQMTFEEFRSTCIGYSDERIKNIYFQITGEKVEEKPIKKAVKEEVK